jgi:hypothetical protein
MDFLTLLVAVFIAIAQNYMFVATDVRIAASIPNNTTHTSRLLDGQAFVALLPSSRTCQTTAQVLRGLTGKGLYGAAKGKRKFEITMSWEIWQRS